MLIIKVSFELFAFYLDYVGLGEICQFQSSFHFINLNGLYLLLVDEVDDFGGVASILAF